MDNDKVMDAVKSLSSELTEAQKEKLLLILHECYFLGASTDHLGPLSAVIFVDFKPIAVTPEMEETARRIQAEIDSASRDSLISA